MTCILFNEFTYFLVKNQLFFSEIFQLINKMEIKFLMLCKK